MKFSAITGLLAFIITVGCVSDATYHHGSSTKKPPTAEPQMTALGHWRLQSMPQVSVRSPAVYQSFTLLIEANGIRGAAVNSYFSDAVLGAHQTIAVSPQFSSTRKLVIGEAGEMEKIYFARLIHANRWQVHGQQLTLAGRKGSLIFRRMP